MICGFWLVLGYKIFSEQKVFGVVCGFLGITIGFKCAKANHPKCRKKKGLIMGLGAGLLYAAILFLVTALASDTFTMGMSKIMTLIVALAGGGIGGIFGVNGKK